MWWRWRNGTLADIGGVDARFLPNRHLTSLQNAIGLRSYVGFETPRLNLVSEVPVVDVICRETGPVAAPIERADDWSSDFEPILDSLGDLVLTWISYIEDDLYLRDPNGGWAEQPPDRLPADVLALGVY